MTDTHPQLTHDNRLGQFLRERRQRLDASALGFGGRRRTAGLRREEVAQRANISATWYTWLEQGRGGSASERVLDSLAEALLLTQDEREHLFLVGLGRPPKPMSVANPGVSDRLQRFLDAMPLIPATVVTACWDIVGWNRAAQLALTDYEVLAVEDRNILRRMFTDPGTRSAQKDWEAVARFLVATFRTESTRAGLDERARELFEDLSSSSEAFRRMWADQEVHSTGEGAKTVIHPKVGDIAFEFSSFAIDGRPDLKLMIYNPATDADQAKISALFGAED